MDVLYLLLPVSVLAMLAILGVFAWALHRGQFDELEGEGARILDGDAADLMPVKPAPEPAEKNRPILNR
jgi:cbb3-type cytochrome oxidase maturation protein